MARLLAVCALFFLAAGSLAQLIDVREIAALNASVASVWTVEPLVARWPYEIMVSGMVPINNSVQEARVQSASSAYSWNYQKDTPRIYFQANISGKTEFAAETEVQVDFRKNTLPAGQAYPFDSGPEMQKYLAESPLVNMTDGINSTARTLAGNSTDALEIIARLAEWTHAYVAYDRSLGDASMSSDWVYANKRGTCDEYAHLLIALARSLGIPAKFVSGYINTGSDWGFHGWAEAWVPGAGWIPVDPTFNEVLTLDGAHIKVAEGIDQSVVKDSLEWTQRGAAFKFDRSFAVQIKQTAPFQEKTRLEIRFTDLGETQEITVKASNPTNEIVFAPVRLELAQGMGAREPLERQAYLKPGESKEFTWQATLPQMEPNTVYTFPVKAFTQGGKTASSFQKIRYEQAAEPVPEPEVYGAGLAESIPLTFKLFLAAILAVTLIAVVAAVWQQKKPNRGGGSPPSPV